MDRIDPVAQLFARCGEAHVGTGAERHGLALVEESVIEAPELGAAGAGQQIEPVAVGELVVAWARLGVENGEAGKFGHWKHPDQG